MDRCERIFLEGQAFVSELDVYTYHRGTNSKSENPEREVATTLMYVDAPCLYWLKTVR